jgi:hypothetical protein
MELIERLPLLKLNYLNQMSLKDFKLFCSANCKNEDERRIKYEMLISYTKSLIKCKGEISRIYSFTEKTPTSVGGRLYCGNSLQGQARQIRGFLCDGITTDIDMKNAHVVIARYICKLNGIACPQLEYYINNRDEILSQFGADGKERFLCALNYDKTNKKETNKILRDFDKECKFIQTEITQLPEYKHIVDTVPDSRIHNWLGSAFNRILCVYENKILQSLISILNKKQISVCALCFDGLLMYGDYYGDKALIKEIESTINAEYVGLNMEWSYKQHHSDISMPDEWQPAVEMKINDNRDYQSVKRKFEETHLLISNKGVFIRHTDNDNIVMTKTHLITSNERISYDVIVKDEIQSKCFILDWLKDGENRMKYDMTVYPHDLVCPDNVFNLWRPFAMERVTEWNKDEKAISLVKNHMKIMCGNDQTVADYLLLWIAQMIQFPSVKSICPTLISKEGAGKGTLMRLIERMLGTEKVLQTTKPSQFVFGNFNGAMPNKIFVNLDEMSKKEGEGADGHLKGLITEPRITINEKGIIPYEIPSYHRFFITTNNEDPVKTSKDDRRKLIIRASDELIGNREYFDKMYAMLEDDNAVRSIYEYFKTLPGADKFGKIPLPETEYHRDIKEAQSSPIELWLRHFVFEHSNLAYVEKTSMEQYESFNVFKADSGIQFECSLVAFALKLKNLKIAGVGDVIHTKTGNKRRFDIPMMKEYFGMGCLL